MESLVGGWDPRLLIVVLLLSWTEIVRRSAVLLVRDTVERVSRREGGQLVRGEAISARLAAGRGNASVVRPRARVVGLRRGLRLRLECYWVGSAVGRRSVSTVQASGCGETVHGRVEVGHPHPASHGRRWVASLAHRSTGAASHVAAELPLVAGHLGCLRGHGLLELVLGHHLQRKGKSVRNAEQRSQEGRGERTIAWYCMLGSPD